MREGDMVTVKLHPNWTADTARLAKSGRIGVVERLFTPLGAREPTARVVFPKVGRFKERIEFFSPNDLDATRPEA